MKCLIFLICCFFFLTSFAREYTSGSTSKNGEIITDFNVFYNPKKIPSSGNIDDSMLLWMPSPRKAAIYSAILPGMGQVYNKKYWKIPIIWGLLYGGLYFVSYNQEQYHKWHNLYFEAVNDVLNPKNYCVEQLTGLHTQARKNYNYAILFTLIIYILNIFDVLVDAHLYEIEHDKDLLVIRTIIPKKIIKNQPLLGLSLHLKL